MSVVAQLIKIKPLTTRLNVLYEFSSPNIAKPFHVGHLRSTFIGSCLANVSTALGHQTTRVTYAGDWGTQMGLLCAAATREPVPPTTITQLYQLYVAANKAADVDPSVGMEGVGWIADLELQPDNTNWKVWQSIRNISMEYLEKTYKLLNVKFDYNQAESEMYKEARKIVTEEGSRLPTYCIEDGRICYSVRGKAVTLLRSDGTSLYMSRDMASLLDKWTHFKPQHIHYVVENSQTEHLANLAAMAQILWPDMASAVAENFHIKFGRVSDQSSREGNVTLVQSVIEKATADYRVRIEKDTKSRVEDMESTTLQLAVNSLVVNELTINRTTDYAFRWKEEPTFQLHYTHVRLCSVLRNFSSIEVAEHLVPQPDCTESTELIGLLEKFQDVVVHVDKTKEPSQLLDYMVKLSHAANRALIKISVKQASGEEASQRYTLFYTTEKVLKNCMDLLGITAVQSL